MAFPSVNHLTAIQSTNESLSTLGYIFKDVSAPVSLSSFSSTNRWSGSPTSNGFWTSSTTNPYKMSSYQGTYRCPIGTVYGASYTIPSGDTVTGAPATWVGGDTVWGFSSYGFSSPSGNAFNFGAYNTGWALFTIGGVNYQIRQYCYNTTRSQGLIRISKWNGGSSPATNLLPSTMYAYVASTFYTLSLSAGTQELYSSDYTTYWTYTTTSNPMGLQTKVLYPI